MTLRRNLFLFILLILLASACSPTQTNPSENFAAPTIAASPTIGPAATATENPAFTPLPTCENYLRYIEDITIPDGTVVSPGERIDKRWLVENSGACNWDASYTLRIITGPEMGATSPQLLYPAIAGTQFELQLIYIAPSESGIYRSAWQAHGPDEQPFGDPVFIEIIVQ